MVEKMSRVAVELGGFLPAQFEGEPEFETEVPNIAAAATTSKYVGVLNRPADIKASASASGTGSSGDIGKAGGDGEEGSEEVVEAADCKKGEDHLQMEESQAQATEEPPHA